MALYDKKFRPTPFGMTEEERNKMAAKVPGTVNTEVIARPRGFARGLADVAASTTDAMQAPYKGLADGLNRIGVGVRNLGREGVGLAPVAPTQFNYGTAQDRLAAARAANATPLAAPRPTAKPATAAIASPGVRFAGIDAAPDNFYRNPPGTQPRSAAELDQASKAETAARNQASLPGASAGAGASTTAGVGAPINKSIGKFGETVYSNVVGQPGTPATAGTMGTVNTQNFGNPVVPQAPGSIARPGVASTFGLGVNDPRMNDAIARPQVQLGPNQTNGFGTLRGPDQMAEQYNSREDREARQATNGNIDTALFMARGKPGSEAAIANLLETKARLNSGAEGLSQEAIQNRGQRDNQFDIAGMEQAGQTQRQQMAGDVTREGNLLDFNAKNRETDASLIEKPQYITDDQRRYLRVGPDGAAPVTDAAGNVIQMPQTQQAQITPDAILKSLDSQEKAITDQLFNAPPEAAASLQERLKSVSAQREQLLRGGGQPQQAKPPAGYPNAKQAPDGKWYVKKDGATYLVN